MVGLLQDNLLKKTHDIMGLEWNDTGIKVRMNGESWETENNVVITMGLHCKCK